MATIPGVSNNELIRTSWGNTVATELNGNVVKKDAAQTMDGPLTVTGALTVNGVINANNHIVLEDSPTLDNHAARKVYVDNTTVALAGDTMTGDLNMGTNRVTGLANPTAAGHAVNLGYADANYVPLDGSVVMTGDLNMNGNQVAGVGTPSLSGHAVNLGYADANYVPLAGGVATPMTGDLYIGGNVPANEAGLLLRDDGAIQSRGHGPAWGISSINLNLERAGSAAADTGGTFVRFARAASAASATTEVGTIKILAGGASIAYNETSDYRLKNDLGPIVDAVEQIRRLAPKHLAWKSDGTTFDGFLAHEVQTVVPYAVTGDKDAVLPPDDEYNPGGIAPQQLDTGKLIPLLTAALQQALSTIDDLTARVAALEGAAP